MKHGRTVTRTSAMVCGALALVVMVGSAAADRIAVPPLKLSGNRDTAATLNDGFRASLEGGLTASGHEPVPDRELDAILRRTPSLAACDTDVCFEKLGQLVAARAVLRTVVEILGSSNYQIRLELHDAAQPGIIATVEDACTICTVREANDAMSRAAAEVGKRFRSKMAPEPVAPVVAPVVETQRAVVQPAPTSGWNPRSRALLGTGIAAMVLGAGGIGAGGYLIATDGSHGDGTGSVNPKTGIEEYNYTRHSLVGGAVLTAAGGVFLVGGSILLWRAHVEKHRAAR